MSVGEAARRIVLGALVISSLCQQLGCQETGAQNLELNLSEMGGTKIVEVSVELGQSRDINLVPGRSYVINCNGEGGFGGSSEVWFFNGTLVTDQTGEMVDPATASVYTIMVDGNNWRVVLQMFGESNTGRYTCRGTNSNVTLVIGTGNPIAISSAPTLMVASGTQAGSRTSLAAFISGTPSPTMNDVTWYFNNQSLPSEVDYIPRRDELLFPGNVVPANAGLYTIRVATSNGIVNDSFLVIVTVQPAPSISPMDKQIQVSGNSIDLICQDSVGVPAPQFRWTHNTAAVQQGGRFTITNTSTMDLSRSVLTIDPLAPGDTGRYECTAQNAHGSSRVSVEVEIQFKPILETFSSQLRWRVGSTATLQTRLVNANPNTSIFYQWQTPTGSNISRGQYSEQMINGSTVYGVTLPSLAENSGGVYTCEVRNSIGTSSQTFDVFITVPPTLEHSNGSMGLRTVLARNGGSQVMLSANVIGAKPPVVRSQVSWRNRSRQIMDSTKYITTVKSTGTQVNLTITMLSMADSGIYTVNIAHEAGTVSLRFNLEVLNPPEPPTMITSTLVDACTADISWVLAQPSSLRVAMVSYVDIEAFTNGSTNNWVSVGRANAPGTSLRGMIPPDGVNTTYWLRARSGNNDIGEGIPHQALATFTAYTKEFFPSLDIVSGAASNDSETITVRWSLPGQNCFNFSSFEVSCMPLEGGGMASSGENRAGRGLGYALVRGLNPDTFYNCSVESSFSGFELTTVTYAMSPIFTFPPKPPAPGVVTIVDRKPTPTTITVEFTLPQDHQNISHYRVYAVRLSSSALPNTLPDVLFSDDSQISTYDEAVSQPDPFDGKEAGPYLSYITAEIAASEFKPRFTIGDGSQTDRKEQFPNGALRASTHYTFFLRAYPKTRGDFLSSRARRQQAVNSNRQYVVFSSSGYTGISKTEEPTAGGNSPPTTDIAIGVVVGVFLILIVTTVSIIVFCCLILKSANSRSYKPDRFPSVDNSRSTSYDGTPDFASMVDTPDLSRKVNGGHELKQLNGQYHAKSPFVPSGPIKMDRFAEHVEMFDSNRQLLFQEEYEWISINSPWNPAEASNHYLNDEKNRYSNITAFDHSRVELTPVDGIECSDYINANFISGYHSEQEYIATQGPLEQTVEDFWRMIWEQNTATIIMLTNLVELGKVKCTQYWPSSGKLIYGNLKVTHENSVTLPDYTIRNLSIENIVTNETRTVLQFHYTRWPDYGTPQLAAPMLNFLRAVSSSNPVEAGPMVVHCSAGVGRSGTVIAVDYCLHQLKEEGIIDARSFVSRMREQRNYMVQTEQQYTFIHYTILESITYGDTSFPLTDFTSLYEKLRAVNPESKKTLMDEEYSRLGQVKTMVKKSAFQKRLKRKGEPPRHFESSFRGTMGSLDSSDNYSGHFIDSYFEKRRFIIAEGPQESTTAKFWQVVWDEDCSFVIMLTPQDSPLLYPYWPLEGEQIQHGNVIVEVESESQEHLYTKREIKLTNAKVDGISHKLIQYQFMGWMENNFPRVPDFVKFVCDVYHGVSNIEGNKKVLMHDIDSFGPAGIMCALCYCVERLGVERMVDIFQAVQSIQLQRPGSIKTMTQYAFTYDCVYEYIRTYSSSP